MVDRRARGSSSTRRVRWHRQRGGWWRRLALLGVGTGVGALGVAWPTAASVAQSVSLPTSGVGLVHSQAAPRSWVSFEQGCLPDVLACGTQQAEQGTSLPPLPFAPSLTQQLGLGRLFPQSWNQLQANPAHDPVFAVHGPGSGLFGHFAWASPLTGDEFLRLARGVARYGTGNGGDAWGAEAAQWLGNVTGVSVVDGIVYVEESNDQLFAVDALTGIPIWVANFVNSAMGDALVENIDGKPVVFVAAGDVGFTLQHALDYGSASSPTPVPAQRGANFSAVYAINGETGQILWKVDTPGEAMPTPVYARGSIFFPTGDGHLWAVNATTGAVESVFANPGNGFSSMSSANAYVTPSGQLYVVYGTQSPFGGQTAGSNLLAVNETNPASPTLAWAYNVTDAINTGLGDVPPVVDQQRGLVLTDALVNTGTPQQPQLNLDILAINARTGALAWSELAGGVPASEPGFVPVAFKGSVPMVHGGVLYVGDLLNQTYQAYSEATGKLLWEDQLQGADPRDLPGTINQPRGGSVFWDGKVIEAEGLHIWTFDPRTGKILNDFMDPGYFGVWGITTPVIVGGEMYLGSISGWAFAVPAAYVTTQPGPGPAVPVGQGVSNGQIPETALVPTNPASFFDPTAAPTPTQQQGTPSSWTVLGGDAERTNAVGSSFPGLAWSSELPHALPLDAPPRDASLFGPQVASVMTNLAFGAGTAVAPANGIVYVGSARYAVEALNATTGQELWSFATINANGTQPLVTPSEVIVASGDPWFNFKQAQSFVAGKPGLHVGASFQNIHALNPLTGHELWTFYTQGSDAMTPVLWNGDVVWLNGKGNLWGISAATGKPVAPFENSAGDPTLSLGGINVVDGGVVVETANGPILVVGTGDPARLYGIDLATDTVAWTVSSLPGGEVPYGTGFAAASPAYDPASGLVVTDVLVDAPSPTANQGTVTSLAVAVDPTSGRVVWSTPLGSGPLPYGYQAASPVVTNGLALFADPVTQREVAVSTSTGQVVWSTPLPGIDDAPGAVVGSTLLQPAGGDVVAISTATGAVLKVTQVGGSFVDQSPTVVGQTVYLPNAWGWVVAMPLGSLDPAAS